VFALSRLSRKFIGQKLVNPVCERFIGYASAAIFATEMFYVLFPFFLMIQAFTIYTFYIVHQGAVHYLGIKEQYLAKFTIFAGILIILAPLIIKCLLSLAISLIV
jgi:hypothetical protein